MTKKEREARQMTKKERILIIGLIILGIALIGFFGMRAARSYIRLQQTGLSTGATDVEAIRGWMTLPYIAHAYDVPEDALFEELGIPKEGNQKRSIWDLVRIYKLERAEVRAAIQSVILRYQQTPTPEAEESP